MDIKLARSELNSKPKTISIKKIEEEIQKNGQRIYYFDKDNSHKEINSLTDYFKKKGFSVYERSIKYGLNENDYMYEVHII